MEEQEKKSGAEKIQSGADKVKLTQKIVKLMGTPLGYVLGYAVIFIIILILFVGAYVYITQMPNLVRDRVVSWLRNIMGTVETDDARESITQEQLVNTAKFIESMGYNLENSGFADKVDRKYADDSNGDLTGKTKEELEAIGDLGSYERGEIVDVKSEVLVEYLTAENRTYVIENDNFNFQSACRTLSKALLDANVEENGLEEPTKLQYQMAYETLYYYMARGRASFLANAAATAETWWWSAFDPIGITNFIKEKFKGLIRNITTSIFNNGVTIEFFQNPDNIKKMIQELKEYGMEINISEGAIQAIAENMTQKNTSSRNDCSS